MPKVRVADLPLAWPTMTRPGQARIVYLDLNHFINLAKYAHGHKAFGHYGELLAAVLRAGADGRAVFPLSSVHYMEVGRIGDVRQRRDVAELIEAVTGFATILDRPTLARIELNEAIRQRLRLPPSEESYPLIGTGVLRAFGRVGGVKVYDGAGADVTASARESVGAAEFDAHIAQAERDLDRAVLTGSLPPEYGELPAPVNDGVESLETGMRSRVQFETDFVERLKDAEHRKFRGERLRDAVSARELIHEWNQALAEELAGVGCDISDVMHDIESAREFTESMPSTRVAISMKVSYHRNPQRAWTMSDVHDIDAASTAVAYCDAVFTDKHVWNAVTTARELEPMATFMPRRPEQLADWINRLP